MTEQEERARKRDSMKRVSRVEESWRILMRTRTQLCLLAGFGMIGVVASCVSAVDKPEEERAAVLKTLDSWEEGWRTKNAAGGEGLRRRL